MGSKNKNVKWFNMCLKKVVDVIQVETGIPLDEELLETVATETAKIYVKEAANDPVPEDLDVFSDTSPSGAGTAKTVIERNKIVHAFKEDMELHHDKLTMDQETSLDFVYEKMLVMADEFDADDKACSP